MRKWKDKDAEARYDKNIRAGLCPHCGKYPERGFKYCAEARELFRLTYYTNRIKDGSNVKPGILTLTPTSKPPLPDAPFKVVRVPTRGGGFVELRAQMKRAVGGDREGILRRQPMPHGAKRWSEEDIKSLLDMLAAQDPIESICEALQRTEAAIERQGRKMGLKEFDPQDFSTPYAIARITKAVRS